MVLEEELTRFKFLVCFALFSSLKLVFFSRHVCGRTWFEVINLFIFDIVNTLTSIS